MPARGIRDLGTPVVQVPGFPFPTQLRENPVSTSVALTGSQLFRNNPDRVFWYVENTSSGPARVGFSRQVSTTAGVLLDSGGAGLSMQAGEDGDAVGWEVFAIAVNAAASIYSFEIVRIADPSRD